jgi:hypothetical protein
LFLLERYYIKVKGMAGSVVAHDTLEDAYTEARRLFDLNGRARRVYVLQAIGALEPDISPETPERSYSAR